MKHAYLQILITIIFSVLCSLAQEPQGRIPIALEEIKISVEKDASREIAYTNKQEGVFYTETNGRHRSGWQGWRVMSQEILDGYILAIDNTSLNQRDATAEALPHQLIRKYSNGVKEIITLLDSIDAIIIELDSMRGSILSLNPFFSDFHTLEECEVGFEQNTLLIARKKHLTRTENENYPVWLGITALASSSSQTPQTVNSSFSPASLKSQITNYKSHFVIVAGDTKEQTISLAEHVFVHYESLIKKRKERMEQLLNTSYIRTANKQFDMSLYWAKLSLDALIMNQGKKGIFAGLPWFDNYWGRDTYISLPGATLVTGNFSDAKKILQSFAEWQDTNSKSTNYGRIPNLVTTTSLAYNTADGTPRFVIELYDYFKHTLDTMFLRKMYPVVKRSIEGTLKYHTDSLFFLTHGDAETWMDAVGPDGAWSPRGNRADDIQALWYKQLNVGFRLAEFVKDEQSKQRWVEIGTTLQTNFIKHFYNSNTQVVYDHLNADNTSDSQLRPNVLFTYSMFLNKNQFMKSFFDVTKQLVYPHGVASLSPEDDNFHPFHHFEPNYVQDAAYHNGIVWTWLAGPWIDLATQFGLQNVAFQVTSDMTRQIVSRGAIGTMSELLDAVPRANESEPRLSGTFSQAWSLAEFIRNCYQSYLGVGVNSNVYKTSDNIKHLVSNPHILLAPKLPLSISKAEFTVLMGNDGVDIEYQKTKSQFEIAITPQTFLPDLRVEFLMPQDMIIEQGAAENMELPIYRFTILPDRRNVLIAENGVVTFNGKNISPIGVIPSFGPAMFKDITLATPILRSDLPSLKGPEHSMLTNQDIKQTNSEAPVLVELADPLGDDKGDGDYVYPRTSYLNPGSLDITNFSISADESNVYFNLKFANLSNPGWHQEYGFQLTYIAIAIDKDGVNNSGGREVGMNSNYRVNSELAFENIIYVGGGIRLADSSRKTIAEYLPVAGDEKKPLGNVATKSIEFSLPQQLLGTPSKDWRYVVLVGCQDDHGGAGIGEFRTVETEAGEWVGGGKKKPVDTNVYDVIMMKK